MRTIWTVGHSTLDLDEFLRIVRDVEVLADVRRFPGSRRYPHFSRASLEQAKPYRWFEALGGRRSEVSPGPSVLRHQAFRAYAAYMKHPEFEKALGDRAALRRGRVVPLPPDAAVRPAPGRRLDGVASAGGAAASPDVGRADRRGKGPLRRGSEGLRAYRRSGSLKSASLPA